jgi:hypothetical protein
VPSASDTQAIDLYLARLGKGLRRLAAPEREEIVEEIRGHILDRLEAADGASGVPEVLRAVGDPGELASQYRTDWLLRRAARSRSPWLLLRTTARWAGQGAAGVFALLVSLLGYGSALVCYVSAVAKPLFPDRIGVWLTPGPTVTVGYWSGRLPSELLGLSLRPPLGFVVFGTFGPTQGPVHEIAGLWLIPAGIVAGFVCAAATTWCVRGLIGRHSRATAPPLSVRRATRS